MKDTDFKTWPVTLRFCSVEGKKKLLTFKLMQLDDSFVVHRYIRYHPTPVHIFKYDQKGLDMNTNSEGLAKNISR